MIKVEEPSKYKVEKVKISSISGACHGAYHFIMPQMDEDKGVMTTYKFLVRNPNNTKEDKYDEDDMNDKENE